MAIRARYVGIAGFRRKRFCANFRNSQTGRHWPLYAADPAIAAGAVFELALTR
jgi:hypothetical protein